MTGLLFLMGSCESARPVIATDATPRVDLRAEAVGCWMFRARAKQFSPAESLIVRLDSVILSSGSGLRMVHRLDDRGRPSPRDAEGFALQDRWSADARSDTIRLVFNNGLHGAHWAIDLPTRATSRDSLPGWRQGFGDVVPAPPHPVQHAMAIRLECVAQADSSTGA